MPLFLFTPERNCIETWDFNYKKLPYQQTNYFIVPKFITSRSVRYRQCPKGRPFLGLFGPRDLTVPPGIPCIDCS